MRKSKFKMLTSSWLKTSVKGNQVKGVVDGVWYKYDFFPQEAIAEVVVSEFLQASGETNYVKYFLKDMTNVCYSQSFVQDRANYIPFAKMLQFIGFTYDVWVNRYYVSASVQERFNLVKQVYLDFGIDEQEFDVEISKMVKLDYLMMNVDRHFNNFGIIYSKDVGEVIMAPVFDNGLSLGVGVEAETGLARIRRALKNTTKVRPFSRVPRKNLSVIPVDYYFEFDVYKFLEIHDYRIDLTYTSFVIFLERISSLLVYDVNGYNIREVFISAFGDWRVLNW